MTKLFVPLLPRSNNTRDSTSIYQTGKHSGQKKRLLLGFLFSSGIGLAAYKKRSLNTSGVVGAITTGTVTTGLGEYSWGLALIFFFVSSSALSHFRKHEKAQTAADKFDKGSQRDIGQVVANGGVATLLALLHGLSSKQRVRAVLESGYIGALATANADTWATELGVLSHQTPRLITTGAPTTKGTSGGITLAGTGAAAAGAFGEGVFYKLIQRNAPLSIPAISLLSGLAGSLFDSLLGATVQVIYYCPTCQKETEQRIHKCGTPTIYHRGVHWMSNDVVNFFATLSGAGLAMLLHLLTGSSTHREKK